MNTGQLWNRTLLITGASRGIGKAIALKAAKDGANIVAVAKTSEPHEKLEGTIHVTADAVVKAGGKCLPCAVDIRDEQAVIGAVEKAISAFNGIDILVNNASAISLTGTLSTPMKAFDLMHNINCRGTYMVSQKCLPYLMKGKNAHILNISPPLNMKSKWFKNHVAYTMAKYGMSMCVLGMAEEFRPYKIAVNALWPKTAIWTAAMAMLGGGSEISKQCRKVDIVADAAYAMLTQDSSTFTGNFCVDEDVLRQKGITNFDSYAVDKESELLTDFFLDSDDASCVQLNEAIEVRQPASVADIFRQIQNKLETEATTNVGSVFIFNITGCQPEMWYLDFKSERPACGDGSPPNSVHGDVTFTLDEETFKSMFNGHLSPAMALTTGRMQICGDMKAAIKLEALMKKFAPRAR